MCPRSCQTASKLKMGLHRHRYLHSAACYGVFSQVVLKTGISRKKAMSRTAVQCDLGSLEALADVEVGGGLVNHVHVRLLRGHHCNGKALQLPS